MSRVADVMLYTLLSAAAGAMMLFVAWQGYGEASGVSWTDRVLVGSALVAAALVGTSMALRPNWRRRLRDREATEAKPGDGSPSGLPGPPRRGHHPQCEPFASHTLPWGGRRVCAGCTGLALGSVLLMAIVLAYMLIDPEGSSPMGLLMVVGGLSLVALDLFAAATGLANPLANGALNALMVLGFAMVAIGLLEATGSAFWGLMGVVLSVLWMDTRIQISRWNHVATCLVCPEGCVAYHP